MTLKTSSNKEEKLYKLLLYYISIMVVPNIFLFNLYNQNQAHIQFNHVAILALILAIISVFIGVLLQLLTRSYEGSYLNLFLFWIIFWFFEFFRSRLPTYSTVILLTITSFALVCLIILSRFLAGKLQKGRIIFSAVSGVIVLLFVFNAFPALILALTGGSSDIENDWQIRRYFEVDTTLPNPDIYWLHIDGMISLNDTEYYFNIPQNESRERLLELEFVINENAEFVAGGTIQGVAALLSPDFYDSYLNEIFMEGSHLLRRDGRQELHKDTVARDGISFPNQIAPYHELFHAFLQTGYTTTMIADFAPYVYTPLDLFYRLGDSAYIDDYPFITVDQTSERHFLLNSLDLIELLVMTTAVPGRLASIVSGERDIEWQAIPTHIDDIDRLTATTLNLLHERQLYRALINHFETLSSDASTLTYITLMFTHAGLWAWQANEDASNRDLHLYPLAHEYALGVMFNMIDMILENNPDAVIILQSDHGMHLYETQEALFEAGFTEEEVLRLYNSVISAVRIPEQYGGLDEPLAPLNITRELVNRFVGENYQFLEQ